MRSARAERAPTSQIKPFRCSSGSPQAASTVFLGTGCGPERMVHGTGSGSVCLPTARGKTIFLRKKTRRCYDKTGDALALCPSSDGSHLALARHRPTSEGWCLRQWWARLLACCRAARCCLWMCAKQLRCSAKICTTQLISGENLKMEKLLAESKGSDCLKFQKKSRALAGVAHWVEHRPSD